MRENERQEGAWAQDNARKDGRGHDTGRIGVGDFVDDYLESAKRLIGYKEG